MRISDWSSDVCSSDLTAQNWVTAFFDKGAEEVLGYYADDFVWEDIEFMQTITTKEELYQAFVVFNNSGPESAFVVHKFELLTYDAGHAGAARGVKRQGGVPPERQGELEAASSEERRVGKVVVIKCGSGWAT